MANVTLKAPSSVVAGSTFIDRDGNTYTIAAGGLLTISQIYQSDALNQGYTLPGSFAASSANITAKDGGVQANATALSYGLNQIATAANAASAVALPLAVPGEVVTVVNDAANTIQVFGTGTDTINGVASATGVSQPGNSVCRYACVVSGQWRAIPQLGFNGAAPTLGSTANGVASNGTTQANGTVLAHDINRVTTVGAANGALTLPASKPGMRVRVTNANGGNTANVFPAANETINSGSANVAVQLTANTSAEFFCAVAGTWDMIKSA